MVFFIMIKMETIKMSKSKGIVKNYSLSKNTNSKRYVPPPPVFIAALFTIAKVWKQPECPSTEELVLTITRYHKLSDLNNRNLFSRSPRG